MKKSVLYTIVFVCTLALMLMSPVSATVNFPQVSGFVTDDARIIDDEVRQQLETRLQVYEQETGNEVVVATVSTLEGMPIETYAVRLFEFWGIGKSGSDNGVLLLIAPMDREMRIEVGYGLEGVVTDYQSHLIITTILAPAFRQEAYGEGIVSAVDALIALIDDESSFVASTKTSNSADIFVSLIFLLFLGFVIVDVMLHIVTKMSQTKSIVAGGVLGGLCGAVVGLMPSHSMFLSIIFGIVVGGLFDWLFSRSSFFDRWREKLVIRYKNRQKKSINHGTGGKSSFLSSGSGNKRSGSNSSSGGFRGFGGGRSGGGGSSGKW